MNFKPLLVCAFLGALSSFARSETVVKILHLQTNPKIIAIWQEAAQNYEKAHPGVKIQFNYLQLVPHIGFLDGFEYNWLY